MARHSLLSIVRDAASRSAEVASCDTPLLNRSKDMKVFSMHYYTTCAVGGAIACGVPHAIVTPLDLVKCRLQVDTQLYRGAFHGWKVIARTEGLRGLYTGWLPTLIGYSMQGACKYGFYELFKVQLADVVGEQNAFQYRTPLYLAASASAEAIADVALCPMEALKVRMQTTMGKPFATSALAGFNTMLHNEGMNGFFKGLAPLWFRQIPHTMMKFTSFEHTVEAIYAHVLARPKETYAKSQQLMVTFTAGYVAGILCTLVSQPADTIVSQMNHVIKAKNQSTTALIVRITRDLGFRGVWRGLLARMAMVGTLTALQWFVYDSYKVYAGLPTAGHSNKHMA